MITHNDWSAASFALSPLSPLVGPFPRCNWLEAWWNHRGSGKLLLAETTNSLIPLTLDQGTVRFAGEADLTDYHTPLGSAAAMAGLLEELPSGTKINLDSLPEDSAKAVADAIRATGLAVTTSEHTVTAVLQLPKTFDQYLASIGKKERHELRRKRRRFDSELGPGRVERRSGPDAVALFADLHRRSSGDKGSFMTEEMEAFFVSLHIDAGGVIDVLVDGHGRPASSIFSFEDDEGFYLYNSAYEPELRNHSPGNVMLSHLIERSIEEGKQIFDFLKGDETYKFRLGAQARTLFEVSAQVGVTA